MSRYIDAEPLEHRSPKLRALIKEQPTADVEPVRHGQWVEVKSWESEKHSVTDMRCNLCGKYASLVLPHKTKCTYKYCPNCGAYMRMTKEQYESHVGDIYEDGDNDE